MTLDMGNTDKLAMFTSEAKKSGIAILPPCVNASEVDFLRAGEQKAHPLLAGGAEEHRRAGGGEPGRRAHGQGRLQGPLRLRRPLQHQGAQQARAGDPGRRRRLRRARAQPRAGARQRRADAGLRQPASASNAAQGTDDLFGGGGDGDARPQMDIAPGQGRGRRWSGCSTSSRRSASSSPAIRSMPMPACLPSSASSHLRRAGGARRPRRGRRPACRHRRVGARAALAEGQQVRLRHVLRADRPVRGGDLLRDAGASAGTCWSPARPC